MEIAGITVPPECHRLVVTGLLYTTLTFVFIALRIPTRIWVTQSYGVDDSCAVLATLGSIGYLIGVFEQMRFGLGLPPNPAQLPDFIHATYCTVIAYTITHIGLKLSISTQCLRIFSASTVPRRLFQGFIAYFLVYGLISLGLTIFTCVPAAKFWDPELSGTCLNSNVLRFVFAGFNIVNDIAILIAPVPFLSRLRLAKRKKIGLIVIFSCGTTACVIAIVRLYSIWAYTVVDRSQRPSKGVDAALWGCLECNIGIICACIPAVRPLVTHMFPKAFGSSANSSGPVIYPRRSRNRSEEDEYGNIANDGHASDISAHIQVGKSLEMTPTETRRPSNSGDSEENLVHIVEELEPWRQSNSRLTKHSSP